MIEDYAVVYFGSAIFKITRLLVVATSSVHFFACIFYRVKEESAASNEDVTTFYTSRNVQEDVIIPSNEISSDESFACLNCEVMGFCLIFFSFQDLANKYVS